jgi:hypothetical protein
MQSAVANDVAATITLEYWDGYAWRTAVDVLDGTLSGSTSLAQTGVIQFSPDIDYSWNIVHDTTDTGAPDALSSVTIYNLYWLRMKFSDTLKSTTALKRIAYAFTQHQQINNFDTTINNYLTDFESGKTTWDDEIVLASYLVVRELKRKGLIQNQGQILRLDDVSIPTDWKTLEIIYRNLGGDYLEKLKEAQKQFDKTISLERYSFDKDGNAFLSQSEVTNSIRKLVR